MPVPPSLQKIKNFFNNLSVGQVLALMTATSLTLSGLCLWGISLIQEQQQAKQNKTIKPSKEPVAKQKPSVAASTPASKTEAIARRVPAQFHVIPCEPSDSTGFFIIPSTAPINATLCVDPLSLRQLARHTPQLKKGFQDLQTRSLTTNAPLTAYQPSTVPDLSFSRGQITQQANTIYHTYDFVLKNKTGTPPVIGQMRIVKDIVLNRAPTPIAPPPEPAPKKSISADLKGWV